VGAALALAALCTPHSALGQVSSPTLFGQTNIPPVIPASTATAAWTGQTNLLTKNCCAAFEALLYCTNSSWTSVTIGGSFTIDGSNFGVAPFTISGIAPSNNIGALSSNWIAPSVVPGLCTNWTQNQLSGYCGVMFNVFTNTSSTNPVLNAGVKLSRPTLNTATY
jgi:hypothetical protein